jgi:hypothetical protein
VARRVRVATEVDPDEFIRWTERVARFLRVSTSDNEAHARVMAALAAEVEAARAPRDVVTLAGLPDWVAREAAAMTEKEKDP